MTRVRLVLAATVVALSVVAHPLAATHLAKAQSVTVTMTEFKFALSTKAVHPGLVTFHLVNKGKLPHDLKIAGKTSARVVPGKTGSFAVTLKKGKYSYLCTVPGHASAGMKGVLTVA